MSSSTVYAFWFLISRHSEGPESNGWTFFYSPFNVDFKNVLDFVIWPRLDWDIAKLLPDAKNKNQHFWSIIGPKITVTDDMCWMILEPFNRINKNGGSRGYVSLSWYIWSRTNQFFGLNQIFSLPQKPAKSIHQKIWIFWNLFFILWRTILQWNYFRKVSFTCNTQKDKDKRICIHTFGVIFGCSPCGVGL